MTRPIARTIAAPTAAPTAEIVIDMDLLSMGDLEDVEELTGIPSSRLNKGSMRAREIRAMYAVVAHHDTPRGPERMAAIRATYEQLITAPVTRLDIRGAANKEGDGGPLEDAATSPK